MSISGKFPDFWVLLLRSKWHTFVPVSNYAKPISTTQCFIETNDIMIDPISEHFSDNISPCNSKVCLTCSSFVIDQSFKSNLTGRIYKLKPMSKLPVDQLMLSIVYTVFGVV